MLKKLNNYKEYIVLAFGVIVTALLTTGIILVNKTVFSTAEFKQLANASVLKLIINNILGFAEGIFVFGILIIFLYIQSLKHQNKIETKEEIEEEQK